MKKQGVVSVWIGKGTDRRVFNHLLEYRVTEEGKFEACTFCRSVGIDSYDPDDFGGAFLPQEINRPRELFHGTELPSKVADRMPDFPPSNCYVLLYDFEYEGGPEPIEIDGFHFQFIGSFE